MAPVFVLKSCGSGSGTTILEPAQPLTEYKRAKKRGLNHRTDDAFSVNENAVYLWALFEVFPHGGAPPLLLFYLQAEIAPFLLIFRIHTQVLLNTFVLCFNFLSLAA
jgi:hypothetical protein